MVIQLTLVICLVTYGLNNTFATTADFEAFAADQNVRNEYIEDLVRKMPPLMFASGVHAGGGRKDDQESVVKKSYPLEKFLGRRNSFFFRNARRSNEDDNSPLAYLFIKNKPGFKTTHYDDTIYKKSNQEDLTNYRATTSLDELRYLDEEARRVMDLAGYHKIGLKPTQGGSGSNETDL